ncbi:MAG: phosphoribosylamine--glycine ligase [Bacillota bacterium]|jgi:phosphoribosylamine--glycine ligase
MNVLVVGGGGREHAIVWKISQSPRVKKVFCAPGNAGIAEIAECIPIDPTDIDGLLKVADEKKIDLTVVGPEAPLVAGLVDIFENAGRRVFGPCRKAALLEGSKSFAKKFMAKYNIPTAPFQVFDCAEKARDYIRNNLDACVVKADGLAAGKGVFVASTKEEALAAVEKIMIEKVFGSAGDKIVVEELLEGEEVSILAFSDGKTIVPMVSSQDHKRAFDGDQGPNTGGMGAYSPAPVYTEELHAVVVREILEPVVAGMNAEGVRYKGVLYAGLMVTEKGPQVLEFNVRFGDPETQPVLFRLETDLFEIIQAVVNERLHEMKISWSKEPSACIVVASGGYPGYYGKGKTIHGLEQLRDEDIMVFHAGTKWDNGRVVTSGGRVLGVTAKGPDLRAALDKAYQCINTIHFDNMYYRRDIGFRALGQ